MIKLDLITPKNIFNDFPLATYFKGWIYMAQEREFWKALGETFVKLWDTVG